VGGVKRAKLERVLRRHGCQIGREGRKHTLWVNPATGQTATVPRHTEVKRPTAREILEELSIDPNLATH
jgi:hypothetical protein